ANSQVFVLNRRDEHGNSLFCLGTKFFQCISSTKADSGVPIMQAPDQCGDHALRILLDIPQGPCGLPTYRNPWVIEAADQSWNHVIHILLDFSQCLRRGSRNKKAIFIMQRLEERRNGRLRAWANHSKSKCRVITKPSSCRW